MNPDGQHLLIRAGGERYLLPVAAVTELLPLPACSPVPAAPDWLVGVTPLHGELVAVVDFASAVGASNRFPPAQCLLFDRNVASLALLVSEVEQMVAGLPESAPAATPIDVERFVSGLEAALCPSVPGRG